MAKTEKNINPISAADIKKYLATQDDFALELFVYNQARLLGLNATHGGTYEDPVTKKFRQFDIRAWIESNDRRIDLCIECKSLRDSFPLILSRAPRVAEESIHQVMFSRKLGKNIVHPKELSPAKSLTVRSPRSIYREHEHVGKSTSQIGKNDSGSLVSNDRDAFDKWAQALASADELIANAVYHYKRSAQLSFITCVLPVLVVSDGTLWVADYSKEGVLVADPTQVNEALLYVGREYYSRIHPSYTISHLHILTKTGAVDFLRKLAPESDIWDALFPIDELRREAKPV